MRLYYAIIIKQIKYKFCPGINWKRHTRLLSADNEQHRQHACVFLRENNGGFKHAVYF